MALHKNVVWLTLMGLTFMTSASSGEEVKAAKKDQDKLTGTWGAVAYVQDGQGEDEKGDAKDSAVKWTFEGDQVTLLADVEDASARATFKLDSEKKPKTIDMIFPPSAESKKGQTVVGIYELDGDTLKLCYATEGEERPTEFKSKAGSKHVLIEFQRLKE